MRKKIMAGTLAAASIAGLGVGVALGVPGISNAATTVQADTSTTTNTSGTAAAAVQPARTQIVSDALAKLVTDGTITQAQSDAVAKALADALPARGDGGQGGIRRGSGIGRGNEITVVATALGVTDAELRTALHGGRTIAQVAATKGVAIDTITAALKADLQTRVATAVTDGKMTQAQADQILADADTHLTNLVNGTGGHGFGGGRGVGGPGGMHGQPPVDGNAPAAPAAPADASDATSATTTA